MTSHQVFGRFINQVSAGAAAFVCAAFILQTPDAAAKEREYRKGPLEIEHVYATATAPGQPHGAVFIKQIKNSGATTDRLMGGRSSVAKSIEVHQMVMEQNVMKMREIGDIEIPAKGRVSLDRGSKEGFHLMLMNLNKPLAAGERFKLTLVFQRAGEQEVDVEIVRPGGTHGHHSHKH